MLTAAQRRTLREARRQLRAWRDPLDFQPPPRTRWQRFQRGAWAGFRLIAGLVLIMIAFGLADL